MKSFNELKFVSLCQNVMTGNVVVSEQVFFRKVSQILYPKTDPITKNILMENTNKLYAFLTTMSSHPMRVPLSHAMSETFLSMVVVTSADISKLLAKHNTEYTVELNEDNLTRVIETKCCPYDDYVKHIVGNGRTKGLGSVKVILIYGNENSEETSVSAVAFNLNIPFKTVRKRLYIDITGNAARSEGKTTKVFASTRSTNRFVDVPNNEIFGTKSPIGEALGAYYKMWRTKERYLAKMYSKFIGNNVNMHFGDEIVSYY